VVRVPAEARLTINNTVSSSTSTTRRLVTPRLEPGKDFSYALKAEFMHEGRPVTVRRRVTVRAGQETRVAFEASPAGVSEKE
jgi:uncharacterized protein (TIGR03000 family)